MTAMVIKRGEALSLNSPSQLNYSTPSKECNIFLGQQRALIGNQNCNIYYNPLEGKVQADITVGRQTISAIPVEGVPQDLLSMRNAAILTRFFTLTRMTPKKNVDGTYRAVEVHVPGPGGMHAKIPFQPGLALGSIVRGDTIDAMNRYAEIAAKMEHIQKQIKANEQGLQELKAKMDSLERKMKTAERRKAKPSAMDNVMMTVFKKQQEFFVAQLKNIPEQLKELEAQDMTMPMFTNFSSGLQSPIDVDRTVVGVDPRGFDGVTFNSQFISMKEDEQSMQDKIEQSSSSSQVSANISGGGWFFKAKASMSHSWSSAAMNRVADIKNQGHASEVLVINAVVTSRNVRVLKQVAYDLRKLKQLQSLMSSGSEADLKKHGISTAASGEKAIYILTEAVMGGSFTGLVTFLDETSSSRAHEANRRDTSASTTTSVEFSTPWVGGGASYSNANQNSKGSSSDQLRNAANMNVSVEFIAQGAIPQLSRDTVVRETLKYRDQNLQNFRSSGSESGSKSREARQSEMQEAMTKTLNSVAKTNTVSSAVSIHGPQSVSKAYDDFCGEITGDTSAGIPIGFNYTMLTDTDIKELIAELEGSAADATMSEISNENAQ